MKSLFIAQEVYKVVQDGYDQLGQNPTYVKRATFKDSRKNDCKALFYIQQSVYTNNFEKISKVSTSKEARDILVKYYIGGDNSRKVKLQALRRQYELLQIEEAEKRSVAKTCEQALKSQVSKRANQDEEKYKRGKGKSKWHKNMNMMKMLEIQRIKTVVTIIARNLMATKGKVKRKEDEALMAQEDDSNSDNVLLMATTKSDDERYELWYLDTGCSNHMTSHKEWFVSINEKVKRETKFVDNITMTDEGVGKELIQRRNGNQSFIYDVLYVPNMKNSLLSFGKLMKKGYSMKIKHGQINMFDSSRRLV
ncbi:uncharacterized protein [Cicer arietinum]|uniref:uncharacterized protein n=1 Tax=Cicer arietinum TaxID=3827 RepID=UPI003CC581FC